MTEQTEILYAGSSIFIDYAIDGGNIPGTMSCNATLLNKDGSVVDTYATTPNLTDGVFELRIPYTDTVGFAGQLHNLIVKVTDTATGYGDVIDDKKISWK